LFSAELVTACKVGLVSIPAYCNAQYAVRYALVAAGRFVIAKGRS